MDANRIWIIGAAIATVAIVVLGWFLGIQPQLNAAASATVQQFGVASMNSAYQAALSKLEADNKNLSTIKDQLAALSASVPSDGQVPAFYDEVNALAGANGVVVVDITAADAVPYSPVKPPTISAEASSGSSSTATPSPTPTPSASASSGTATPTPGATAAPVAGAPEVTSPLITPTTFAAIPIKMSITGDSPNILSFVKGLQTAKRLFLVYGLTTSVPPTGSTIVGVQATVSGFIYVVPTAVKAPIGAG